MKDNPKYFARYYFSRAKGQTYRIQDRKLHLHIATCDFREAAASVVRALNGQDWENMNRASKAEEDDIPKNPGGTD